MERVRSLLLVSLMLGSLVGHMEANFQECYGACFILCAITPNHTLFQCSLQCLKDCITVPPDLANLKDSNAQVKTQYFCKLGCASYLCTNLSTRDNPAVKRVASCVDSCSGQCTNRC